MTDETTHVGVGVGSATRGSSGNADETKTADDYAAEYEETKRRVIAGTASVQEAQGFIDFIEGAIPAPVGGVDDEELARKCTRGGGADLCLRDDRCVGKVCERVRRLGVDDEDTRERVARAIWSVQEDYDEGAPAFAALHESARDELYEQADRAIAAAAGSSPEHEREHQDEL